MHYESFNHPATFECFKKNNLKKKLCRQNEAKNNLWSSSATALGGRAHHEQSKCTITTISPFLLIFFGIVIISYILTLYAILYFLSKHTYIKIYFITANKMVLIGATQISDGAIAP